MVGPAYTMRYIPAREDLDHLGVFEDRSHPQRKGIEECPPGHVFVIDSRRNPSAASAGGILVTRLWKRGAAGIVTDGGFRDLPEIARLPFPAYHAAPAAPTNLIKHHAVDLDVPIACGEVAVYPGDVLVGDGEGVAVIPQHIAEDVAEEAFEQTAFEDFVQEQVERGPLDLRHLSAGAGGARGVQAVARSARSLRTPPGSEARLSFTGSGAELSVAVRARRIWPSRSPSTAPRAFGRPAAWSGRPSRPRRPRHR